MIKYFSLFFSICAILHTANPVFFPVNFFFRYDGFRYTMSSSTCNKKFEDKFNYDIVCAEDKSQNCRQKINSLVLTQSWRAQNPADGSTPRAGAGQGGLEGFLATCIMNSSETTETRRRSRRLAEYTPTVSKSSDVGANVVCNYR